MPTWPPFRTVNVNKHIPISSSMFSSSFGELLLLSDSGVKLAEENIEASSSEVVEMNCSLLFASLSLALLPLMSFIIIPNMPWRILNVIQN